MQKKQISLCRIVAFSLVAVVLISSALAYSHYLTLKRLLLSEMSRKASAMIGQGVTIGDLSYDLPAQITVDDIVVANPEGFDEGQLLKVKRVSLGLRWRALFSGRLAFGTIGVEAPELTLMRDRNNRPNISDALRAFFSKEGTTQYEIDTLKIHSGVFDPYDHRFRVDDISFTLENLSSAPGTKTLLKGTASMQGTGMSGEGWIFLKDDPIKFSLSTSLKGLRSSLFGETAARSVFGADVTADMRLQADGDTKRGVTLTSEVSLKGGGLLFAKKEVTLTADVFFDIAGDSLDVRNAAVQGARGSFVRLRGVVNDVTGTPSYRAQMRVDIPDLAAFSLMKGVKAGGEMTSDAIDVEGKFDKTMPSVSGSLRIRKAFLETADVRAEGIDAKIDIAAAREITAAADVSGRLLRAGKYALRQPAEVRCEMKARGRPESLALVSSARLFPLVTNVAEGKDLRIESVDAQIKGNLRGGIFSGETSARFGVIRYADNTIAGCRLKSAFDYRKGMITLKNPEIRTDNGDLSAESLRIKIPERRGPVRLEAKDLGGSYREKEAAVRKLDLSAALTFPKEGISGTIDFSGGELLVHDADSGVISGKAKFDAEDFSLAMKGERFFHGTLRFSAKGAVSGGPFPMTLAADAASNDLDGLVRAASHFFNIPYRLGGKIDRASFQGTADSMKSLRGNAEVQTRDLSVVRKDGNRTIVKDALMNAGATFRGKDMDFRVEAAAGNLSGRVSGTVSGFMEEKRSLRAEAVIPEMKIAEIRSTFWDIFPDALLYAGLEGSLSADVTIGRHGSDLTAEGELRIKDLVLEGENGEYSIGPVNGAVPLHYSSAAGSGEPLSLPQFEKSQFEDVGKNYAGMRPGAGFREMSIGSLRYGFRLLQDIDIWVGQTGRYLNVGRFSATIFGGKLEGSAVVTLSEGLKYRAGMIVKGMSLTTLCSDIAPLKGYLSGKVDGIALVKGAGGGMKDLIGWADFWTYSAGGEKMKISREFLEKVGGPAVKSYLGERPFDKGIISMYLENGFLVFKELEISHTNLFGMTDLSVKVAPFNNRIALDHFLSTIAEAAARAREK